jgi:hypothetical protein
VNKEVVEDVKQWSVNGASARQCSEALLAKYKIKLDRHQVRRLIIKTKKKAKGAKSNKAATAVMTSKRKTSNDSILVISDMHQPYAHPDTLAFLTAIKVKYAPTRVICMGDEVDKHAMSFHDHDPDLMSPGDELRAAIKKLQPLYKLFPVVDVLDSNHGSLAFRKAKHAGISRKYLRDYGDVLQAPAGWKWQHDMHITLPTGNECYFHHGLSSDALKVAERRHVCVVQGHFHSLFAIQYAGNPRSLLWSMQTGCLIDKDSLAFAYDNANLPRPIIGLGIIIDGYPKLLPMALKRGGRWNGVTP